jgi:predicted GNAT family N-acyltransferase
MAATGGCACGAIRYRVSGELHSRVICHCRSCRRATGALQVPWFTVPRSALQWLKGEPLRRESSPGTWRSHCAACGTALTYEAPGPLQPSPEIDVTTVSLDEPEAAAPEAHIWTGDDQGWMRGVGQLPRFAGWRSTGQLDAAGGLPAGVGLFLVDWQQSREELMSVRTRVFVEEQGVPPSMEQDEHDPACLHLLARRGDEPVGTARLDLGQGESRGKVGRVAVLAALRGQGVGVELMRALHAQAAARGLGALWCHAQLAAIPFYLRLGYRAEGPEFAEAGIAHRLMRIRLDA